MASGISPSSRFSRPSRTETMSDTSRLPESEPPAKKRRVFLQTMGQQLREFGSIRDNLEDEPIGFNGRTPSGIYFIRSVYGGLAADRASRKQNQIQTPESDIATGEEDQFTPGLARSASKYLWRPTEVEVPSIPNTSQSFSFDDLIDWSRSYFDNWHPAYPFLHAPSILEFLDEIAQNGLPEPNDMNSLRMAIVRSIMSIALADRRQTNMSLRPIPENLVFKSFRDAIDSIHGVLADESSVPALQAVVSVQLFLLSMLRYNAVSRLEGIAVRMAFQLGLHHCPLRPSAFSQQEAQLRQRLFWSIYCIDRYISNRLGLPLSIRDDDVDVCYPGSDQQLDDCNHALDNDARLHLLGFLARHATIRGSIMELRSKPNSRDQNEDVQSVAITAELTKWWNEVDEYLESNGNEGQPSTISHFHQVILSVSKCESIIALNRAILARSKSVTYNASIQNCIGASRSVIGTLHKALVSKDGPGMNQIAGSTPLLWPSFTWAVWMSAFIMIHAANEDQTSKDVAVRFADRSLEILKHLATRGSIWPEACIMAIQDLRAQLLDREKSSRQNQRNNGQRDQDDRGRGQTSRAASRRTTRENSRNGRSNNQTRMQETPYHDANYSSNHFPMVFERQESGDRNDITSASGARPDTTSYHPIDPFVRSASRSNNLSGANSVSDFTRHNTIFPDLSNYIDPQWNGSGQQGFGFSALTEEGMDLFYGSDIPFWMGDN